MVAEIKITKGLEINLSGRPSSELNTLPAPSQVSVFPSEYEGLKFKLLVKEGDLVKRGSPLAFQKKHEGSRLVSPLAGTVKEIKYGARRSLQEIVIEANGGSDSEAAEALTSEQILSVAPDTLLERLCATGRMLRLKARPFGKPVDVSVRPKSIFINAMSTAPFRPDARVVIKGREAAFQAGIHALSRLTDGDVYLCIHPDHTEFLHFKSAKVHAFSGPHPAGNTSTHIHHLDPILPGDVVWTAGVNDVVSIGQTLLSGVVANEQVVCVGGPHAKESAARHYKVVEGTSLATLLKDATLEGEFRVVAGDVFNGDALPLDTSLRVGSSSLVILAEDRERHFMGWLAPGASLWSNHRVFLSKWFGGGRSWSLGTSRRGSLRSMVMTGIYDSYVPLNIMVDFLARACIANDTDEAIKLGILECAPEDFALCTVVCPSKTDFGAIVQRTLNQIELEGV